jgi:hypothetical protein
MNHRAFFFTFIAFAILVIFILIFSVTQIPTDSSVSTDRALVDVANAYSKDLTTVFLPRVMKTSSRTAFETMTDYVATTKNPIDDVNLRMQELLVTGTLYGIPQTRMENQTLTYWTGRIIRLGEQNFRINTTIAFSNTQVLQDDPWTVVVFVQANVLTNASDTLYTTGTTIYSNLSLLGWRDPLFLLNGKNRMIAKTSSSRWNESLFMLHMWNASYDAYSGAPSFLMRLENISLPSTCCGIESILNDSWGDINRSYVDYLFYNGTYNCSYARDEFNDVFNLTTVQADPLQRSKYLKMDSTHAILYNITEGSLINICD